MMMEPHDKQLVWWTDVLNTWTLRFPDRPREARFVGTYLAAQQVTAMIVGSPVLVCMGLLTATRSFAFENMRDHAVADARRPYLMVTTLLATTIRSLPVVGLMHCQLLTPYGWLRALFLEVASGWLLAPLISCVPFRLHLLLAVPEVMLASIAMASSLGACGSMQTLLQTGTCPKEYDPAFTSSVTCGLHHDGDKSILTSWIPFVLEPAVKLLLRSCVGAPPWAVRLATCMYASDADIASANKLARHLQALTAFVSSGIAWILGDGTYHASTSATTLSQCTTFMMTLVVVGHTIIACMIYNREVQLRCQFFNEQSGHCEVAPPARVLRSLLVFQQACLVWGVLVGLWCSCMALKFV